MNRFFLHAMAGCLLVAGAVLPGRAMALPFSYVTLQPDMRWAYAIRNDDDSCHVQLTGPAFEVVTTEGGRQLTLPGTTAWTQPGQPRLPVFPAVFQLDASARFTIEVTTGEFREISLDGILLPEPHQFSVSDDDTRSRVVERHQPDAALYAADAFWPSAMYEINEAKGGGQRYLRIGLIPFQYHPLTQTLRYYPDLTVTVRFSEPEANKATP
jgi:hypothetical protein